MKKPVIVTSTSHFTSKQNTLVFSASCIWKVRRGKVNKDEGGYLRLTLLLKDVNEHERRISLKDNVDHLRYHNVNKCQ